MSLPNIVTKRMARFFMDSASASSANGNLLDLGLDTETILTGILQPENIAIHVAQNAVNFLVSSLGWLAIGAFASQTSLSGRGIDPDIISAAAASHKTTGHLQPILLSPSSHSGHAGLATSHATNSISVPFMSREISPLKSKKIVKELPPALSSYKQQQPEQKKKFILKHLSNRNFVASVPFPKKTKKKFENYENFDNFKNPGGDMDNNRRIMKQNNAIVDEDDIIKSRKLVKKVVKKVINVES